MRLGRCYTVAITLVIVVISFLDDGLLYFQECQQKLLGEKGSDAKKSSGWVLASGTKESSLGGPHLTVFEKKSLPGIPAVVSDVAATKYVWQGSHVLLLVLFFYSVCVLCLIFSVQFFIDDIYLCVSCFIDPVLTYHVHLLWLPLLTICLHVYLACYGVVYLCTGGKKPSSMLTLLELAVLPRPGKT